MTRRCESSGLVPGRKMTWDAPPICSARRRRAGVSQAAGRSPSASGGGHRGEGRVWVPRRQLSSATPSLPIAAPRPSTPSTLASRCHHRLLSAAEVMRPEGSGEQVVIMTDTMTACADMSPARKTPRRANKSSWKGFLLALCLLSDTSEMGGRREGGRRERGPGIQRDNRPA